MCAETPFRASTCHVYAFGVILEQNRTHISYIRSRNGKHMLLNQHKRNDPHKPYTFSKMRVQAENRVFR
jgi:hypothetical protein